MEVGMAQWLPFPSDYLWELVFPVCTTLGSVGLRSWFTKRERFQQRTQQKSHWTLSCGRCPGISGPSCQGFADQKRSHRPGRHPLPWYQEEAQWWQQECIWQPSDPLACLWVLSYLILIINGQMQLPQPKYNMGTMYSDTWNLKFWFIPPGKPSRPRGTTDEGENLEGMLEEGNEEYHLWPWEQLLSKGLYSWPTSLPLTSWRPPEFWRNCSQNLWEEMGLCVTGSHLEVLPTDDLQPLSAQLTGTFVPTLPSAQSCLFLSSHRHWS